MASIHIAETADGSLTYYHAGIGEHYHSKHGALQESLHVFVEAGLKHVLQTRTGQVNVLEVGFGTGLNFILSAREMAESNIVLCYTGIEAFPLTTQQLEATNYGAFVPDKLWTDFVNAYPSAIGSNVKMNELTSLRIFHGPLLTFDDTPAYDVMYYDAFAAVHQPEMWTEEALAHAASFLRPGGVFVTYAITGHLKRTMKALGFRIEKLSGAPGKREMLRATRQ